MKLPSSDFVFWDQLNIVKIICQPILCSCLKLYQNSVSGRRHLVAGENIVILYFFDARPKLPGTILVLPVSIFYYSTLFDEHIRLCIGG